MAAAPSAPTNSLIPTLAGTASSSLARAAAARCRHRRALRRYPGGAFAHIDRAVARGCQVDENRIRNQRDDLVGDRSRRDQITSTGDDDRRPAELRHRSGEVVGLAHRNPKVAAADFAETRRRGPVACRRVSHRSSVLETRCARPDPARADTAPCARTETATPGPEPSTGRACLPAGDRVGGSAPRDRRGRRRPR